MIEEEITFKHWARNQETMLRGIYLSMAADTEWLLVAIIAHFFDPDDEESFIRVRKEAEIKTKDLFRFTLEQKTKMTIICLQLFDPELYIKHESDFKSIEKIRDLRNKFAHGRMIWNEETEDTTTVEIMTMTANGIESHPYDREELWKDLIAYCKNITGFLRLLEEGLGIEPSKV